MPRFLLVYLKIFISLFFFVIIFFGFPNESSAVEIWSDDFNTADTSRWTILNETDIPVIFSGEALFRNVTSTQSLFFQNITPIPVGDVSIEVKFKYTSGSFGSGISVNNNPVALRSFTHPDGLDWTITVWPVNSNTFKVFSSICPATGPCVVNNVYKTVTGTDFYLPHNLKIEYISGRYILYFDEIYIGETALTDRAPRYLWLGNPMTTGGVSFSNFYVDKVSISDFSSPLPTFPHLSQKDPAWGSIEYDSANVWAGAEKKGIERWGCVITSVAMMLQKYGVKDLNGNEMKPDWLNTWLKSQPDGYIGPGYVNWLAIARYAKGRATEGKSLEFVRSYDTNNVELPAILGLPGHFVVAHGEDVTNWKINDPNLASGNTDLVKTTPVTSINRYVLSSTDLSYMLFTASSGLTASMTDASGSAIPANWVEEFLTDDVEGLPGPSIFTAMIPKPISGRYRLEIDNNNNERRKFNIFLYDQNGEVKQQEVNVEPGEAFYEIDFNAESSAESEVNEVDTTAPKFVVTVPVFAGWKTSDQTAQFEYADANLRDDYVHPSCVITSEGVAQTCSITPSICDQAGNCNTDLQTSNPADIDKTPPVSLFNLPAITNSWNGVIAGSANDNLSGVARVELLIKTPDGAESSIVASGTENWSYTLPSLIDGQYVIKSRATDTAGNSESEPRAVMITLDRVAPSVPRILWVKGWWQRIWIDWRGVNGASKYLVYLGSKRDQLNKIDEVSQSDWVSGVLKQGQYYVAVSALDEAGNESLMSRAWKVEVHKKWDWRRLRFGD